MLIQGAASARRSRTRASRYSVLCGGPYRDDEGVAKCPDRNGLLCSTSH